MNQLVGYPTIVPLQLLLLWWWFATMVNMLLTNLVQVCGCHGHNARAYGAVLVNGRTVRQLGENWLVVIGIQDCDVDSGVVAQRRTSSVSGLDCQEVFLGSFMIYITCNRYQSS